MYIHVLVRNGVSTYRRLLLQLLPPRRLRAQIRKHPVVLSPPVYSSRRPRRRCVELRQLRYAPLPPRSRRPQRAIVNTWGLVRRPPHEPLAVIRLVVVRLGVERIGQSTICVVGKRVVGQQAARCCCRRRGAAVERWGWRGGDGIGSSGAGGRVGGVVVGVVVVGGYLVGRGRVSRGRGWWGGVGAA